MDHNDVGMDRIGSYFAATKRLNNTIGGLLFVYALGMTAVAALCVWFYGQGQLAPGNFIGVMFFVFSLYAPIKHMSESVAAQASSFIVSTIFDCLISEKTEEEAARETKLASEFCIAGLRQIWGI